MGLFHFALEALGKTPDLSALSPAGGRDLPHWVLLATWLLEAVALSALFLLIHARGGPRWTTGLLAGWIAWIFRGPLLVVTVVELAGLPAGPWWSLTLQWLIRYSLCGLLMAGAAAAADLRTYETPAVAPLPLPERQPAAPRSAPPAVPPSESPAPVPQERAGEEPAG